VRLDAEKGYAVGFVAWSGEFDPCWYLHDVLEVSTVKPPGSLSPEQMTRSLVTYYDDIVKTLSSDLGLAHIEAMQSPYFDEWAAESAALRDPANQASLAGRIKEAGKFNRQLWGPIYRRWALTTSLAALGVAAMVYVLNLSHFVR